MGKKCPVDSGLIISKCQATKGEGHKYGALLLRIIKWHFMDSVGSGYGKHSFQGNGCVCKMQAINLGKIPGLPENHHFQKGSWSGLRSFLFYSGYVWYKSLWLFLSWYMWVVFHSRKGNHNDLQHQKISPTVFRCWSVLFFFSMWLLVADCIWRIFVFDFMDSWRHLTVTVLSNGYVNFMLLIRWFFFLLFFFYTFVVLKSWVEMCLENNFSGKFWFIFLISYFKFILCSPSCCLSVISLQIIASEYTARYRVTEGDDWTSFNWVVVWNSTAADMFLLAPKPA